MPPVAVLPNGKTNLIALDLGSVGDPIEALKRVLEIAHSDMNPHIVQRELIALTDGSADGRPVLGMFLGGAGLADTILYCRNNLYPLGLPNAVAHAIALVLGLISTVVRRKVRFLPMRPERLKISVLRHGELQGQFALLMVTTLQRLLFKGHMPTAGARPGGMQLLVIERSLMALIGAFFAALRGRLGRNRLKGVHLERGDEIRIEGDHSNVILDGEMFEASRGQPIVLKPTAPMPFLRLAA